MRSKTWNKEHEEDHYVQRAHKEGWRSRAVYKLEEIDKKYNLIQPGMNIVDLGAAPGGWSQYVAKKVGNSGKLIAIDILDMIVGQSPVNLVLSDMAPNISGISSVDQPKAMYLAELAAEFALEVLAQDGGLLVKLFQGSGFDDYVKMLRSKFCKVLIRKPEASRSRSREMYALATGIKL